MSSFYVNHLLILKHFRGKQYQNLNWRSDGAELLQSSVEHRLYLQYPFKSIHLAGKIKINNTLQTGPIVLNSVNQDLLVSVHDQICK